MNLNIDPQDLIDALCEKNGPQTTDILRHVATEVIQAMLVDTRNAQEYLDRTRDLEGDCERLQREVVALQTVNKEYVLQGKMRVHGSVRIYASEGSREHKLQSISNIHYWLDCGLKEAKDAVEAMMDDPNYFVEAPRIMDIHDATLGERFRFEVVE